MDCSPPGSSVCKDFPGKNIEVGCHFLLQEIFWPRDQTCVSCLAGGFFTTETHGKLYYRIPVSYFEDRFIYLEPTHIASSSPTWTWVWESSGSWWWTGKPGMLQSMRSQRAGHNWMTELNWVLIFYKAVISAEWMAPLKVYMTIWTAVGSDPAERTEVSWPRWLLRVFPLIFLSPEPFPDFLNPCKALPSEKTGRTYAHHQGWWL